MADFIYLELDGAASFINGVYGHIFPEYPRIGLYILALAFILFFIYWLKSGVQYGAKIALLVICFLTFILAAFHHLGRLFHL